jgi:hypothetical protein
VLSGGECNTSYRFRLCVRSQVVNWRNGVERDLSEVLQVRRVFLSVSKVARARARLISYHASCPPQGVVASGEDLTEAFGTDDHEKACLEILRAGDLQVAAGAGRAEAGGGTLAQCSQRDNRLSSDHVIVTYAGVGGRARRCTVESVQGRRDDRDGEVREPDDAAAIHGATRCARAMVSDWTSRARVHAQLSMIERAMHDAHIALVPTRGAKQQVCLPSRKRMSRVHTCWAGRRLM